MTAVLLALIDKLPAILTGVGLVVTAFLSFRNGKKTDRVDAKADGIAAKADGIAVQAGVAAKKADVAAVTAAAAVQKANEVHETTKTIQEQTNGHLSRLTDDLARLSMVNDGLQATIITLTGVLNARQVRRTDLVEAVMQGRALGEVVPPTQPVPTGPPVPAVVPPTVQP